MIHHTQCPVCSSEKIFSCLSAIDYTVSGESFVIWHCTKCTTRFTNDIPAQAEITSYYQSENYISHSNTAKGLINRLYHFIRSFTLKSKGHIVKKITKKSSGHILDIGCGTGLFLKTMQDNGWKVTGIEPDAGARKIALEINGINALEAEKLSNLSLQAYDAITLWHVLEHVHELHDYMEQIKKLLAPGGILFIAVPNYTSYDAKHYQQYWAAYDVPRHLYHFSPAGMKILLNKHGMEVKKMLPLWFDSFYVSMLSEKYRSGKSNYINAMFQGIISNASALFNTEKCSSVIYVVEKD